MLFDVVRELDLKLATAADGSMLAIRLNNVILHQSKPSGAKFQVINFLLSYLRFKEVKTLSMLCLRAIFCSMSQGKNLKVVNYHQRPSEISCLWVGGISGWK